MHSVALDRTFHALADGTRRTIVHTLARTPGRTAGELGRRFRSAQPTISKHLKVLEDARLVERVVEGRTHRFRLRHATLSQAARWIARHEAFWRQAVGRLDALLAEDEDR
jgi:DNA-binding transcriptional ArsR family regulator